jgi:hypothetical protein
VPVSVRHRGDQPFTSRRPAIDPAHVRGGPGLIQEDQLFRDQKGL